MKQVPCVSETLPL